MIGVLAITWLDHQRIRQLCAGLGFELVVMTTSRHRLIRYALLSARTLGLLWQRRPRVLVVQNPSLVLATLAVLMQPFFRYHLIVDAHNAAIAPYVRRPRWITKLSQWLVHKADLTIVTNRQLADIVSAQRGRPFTLPDRVPVPPPISVRGRREGFVVALIATFAADEPIAEVFEAVREMDVLVYVTGDHRRMSRPGADRVPANVHFCGFLADSAYWELLSSVDGVIDLTRTDHCLVCGAYEALAVGTPMLLSQSAASVELFGRCALFTDNSPADIRRALTRLRHERDSLQAAAAIGRRELQDSWNLLAKDLTRLVAGWDHRA
jgi:glycosyltransferase involved in cell wall biosynthesis